MWLKDHKALMTSVLRFPGMILPIFGKNSFNSFICKGSLPRTVKLSNFWQEIKRDSNCLVCKCDSKMTKFWQYSIIFSMIFGSSLLSDIGGNPNEISSNVLWLLMISDDNAE